MSHYPSKPSFCPACECPEILEKTWKSAFQDWVSFSCPRCMWKDAGLAPLQPPMTARLAPAHTPKGFRAREVFAEPQARHYGPVDRIPLPEEEVWPSSPST